MHVVVRPPVPADARALGLLHNYVWRVTYAGLMPEDVLRQRDDAAAVRRWEKAIAGLNAEGTDAQGRSTLVAAVEGSIAGFLRVGPGRDVGMSGRLELMSLYVRPDLHGGGVAQALTGRGLPTGPSYLWVLDGNVRAQSFYQKLGYELDGATKVHEPTSTTEVRMVRPGPKHTGCCLVG